MKTLLFLISTLFFINPFFAQKDYFQQQVNYKIDAQLDDSLHVLMGTIEMEYINNSPDELTEIYMHLWPNAYSNKETAFAQQQLQNNSTDFYFAKKKQLGALSGLNFLVNGQAVQWESWEGNVDIVLLQLKEPLSSGSSATISTAFSLKIPASFSRLGHVEQSYQMTQWYPKPAVYDRKGWHPMPYLDMGEFFSEFGDFEVTLTLPNNYVVGATGTLQTKSEYAFLEEKMKLTKAYFEGKTSSFLEENAFPESDKKLKTLRYTAENVHDFAWFADKRFRVVKDEVALSSGKKVETWVMFTEAEEELWENAIEYVNRSVLFYSDKVGEYPYPQATAVQSALSAGGGMEYPMITVIGISNTAKALDNVITHEVGHNWFYGILASNERIHPWMDEGLNSYYEGRYMKANYEAASISDMLPKFLKGASEMSINEAGYLFQARRNLDQAPDTHSNDFTRLNYGLSAYSKPAMILDYLEAYLGTSEFDKVMKGYYEQWKFKHPYPEDFRASLEAGTGKDLSWLFDDLFFSSKKMDYALTAVKESNDKINLTIKNKGTIVSPFPVSAVKDGEVVATQWYEGVAEEAIIEFENVDYDDLVIDVERVTLDLDRTDNRKKANPINSNIVFQLEDDYKRSFSLFPALSWNKYDQFMLGIGIHNKSVPFRNLEFVATPMFGFGSERLAGVGSLRYNIYPSSEAIERISLQLNGRTFSYNYNEDFDYYNYFSKFVPTLDVKLGKKSPTSPWSQRISYRYINISQDIGQGIANTEEVTRNQFDYAINELSYSLENSNPLSPSVLNATLEQSAAFTKLFASYTKSFPYQDKNKGMQMRFFGGYFFDFDGIEAVESRIRPSFLLSGNTSNTFQQDYLYDQVLFGRSEREGIFSRQIFNKDAGFKTLTSSGSTTNWMLSANLRSTLPGALPLEVFGDLAYSAPEKGEGDVFYSAGLVVPVVKNIFEIYVPLVESSSINANHSANGREGILERITFRLDLMKLNPFNLVDELDLN